ncbi:MAG: M50 family metallopeptidase [Parcubacteria group bacterium]
MNLGILIILIAILGYISNWLNWRYLNHPAVRFLYYCGTIVHELSHAIFCILTGAKITEFSVFSRQPHVVSLKPKIPFVGPFLVSLAPIIGGLFFLFALNKYFLEGYFIMPQVLNLPDLFLAPFHLLSQINFSDWQSWLMILLFLNVGAMIGPSFSDLKNIWPLLIIAFFVKSVALIEICLLVASLVLTNLFIQTILIFITSLLKRIFRIGN